MVDIKEGNDFLSLPASLKDFHIPKVLFKLMMYSTDVVLNRGDSTRIREWKGLVLGKLYALHERRASILISRKGIRCLHAHKSFFASMRTKAFSVQREEDHHGSLSWHRDTLRHFYLPRFSHQFWEASRAGDETVLRNHRLFVYATC